MGSPITLQTGTAADLLHFEKIQHVTKQCERLTRVATADENWITKDWDNETYYVRFDKNFSKKHLFTFCKDQQKTAQKAAQLGQNSGKSAQENWHDAEMELLKNKIAKNLSNRAKADVCQCGHAFNKHLHPNQNPPPQKIPGNCTQQGCACLAFKTGYGLAREYVGKPTSDPLSGATTNKNTCIILNWVPKAEFEDVVVKSIQAVEKPQGWVRGAPLAVPVLVPGNQNLSERDLTWDFGVGRMGAVIIAQNQNNGVIYQDKRGCQVKAVKVASEIGKQTWKVFHMGQAIP